MELNSLSDVQRYFDEVLYLLHKWKWVFESRATHVLVDRVIQSNLNLLQVDSPYGIPFGRAESDWPRDLKEFAETCDRLCLRPGVPPCPLIGATDQRGIAKKKQHEVSTLKPLICHAAEFHGVTSFVDIGSGLGYLDRSLCRGDPAYKVLAVECDPDKTAKAAVMNADEFNDRITQFTTRIQWDTIQSLTKVVVDDSLLFALHACGDLSLCCLRIFQCSDRIKSAVIVSCCYHKMTLSSQKSSGFPFSATLRTTLDQVGSAIISPIFLRLACEASRERWSSRTASEHEDHAKAVLFRAIIQLFISNGFYVRKRSRSAAKVKARDWPNYVNHWLSSVDIADSEGLTVDLTTARNQLNALYEQYAQLLNPIKVYNCLQMGLQGAAEGLVLADSGYFKLGMERLSALFEKGYSPQLQRTADPTISPRSIAIIVHKTKN